MSRIQFKHFLVVLFVALVTTANASQDTIGPNGIRSAGLLGLDNQPLTGAGIFIIGQEEGGRPGDVDIDVNPMLFNDKVDPDVVYFRDPGPPLNFNATPNAAAETSPHAVGIAGIMISKDPMATGVATGAHLHSVGHGPTPTADVDGEVATALQFLATRNGGDVRAINLSFGLTFSMGDSSNGNRRLTQFVDWSANHHEVLYVVAGNQSPNPPMPNNLAPTPKDNFNGMTIGSSAKDDNGKYRLVGPMNDFSQDATGDRTSISLIAPGDDVLVAIPPNNATALTDGTSNAAPHVVGTVALLQQFAEQNFTAQTPKWDTDAWRHQTMKAVLMNSADKIKDDGMFMHPSITSPVPAGGFLRMDRTVLTQNGDTWFDSPAANKDPNTGGGFIPVDLQMGAGHLNAQRALTQFKGGDNLPGDVPVIGWSFSHLDDTDDINKYVFNQKLLKGGFISITLAFDRIVTFDNDANSNGEFDFGDTFTPTTSPTTDDQISDIDLYLLPKGAVDFNAAIAQSISVDSTIDHIFFQIPETGEYEFWLHQYDMEAGLTNYAVAWWALPLTGGDFDGDGDVDGADFVVWQTNFPTASGATLATGDADGDGDVDGADFVVWQTNFPYSPPSPGVAPVPEPPTIFGLASAAMALAFVRRRKTA